MTAALLSDKLDAMRPRRRRFPLPLDFGEACAVVHRGPLSSGEIAAIRARLLKDWGPPHEATAGERGVLTAGDEQQLELGGGP